MIMSDWERKQGCSLGWMASAGAPAAKSNATGRGLPRDNPDYAGGASSRRHQTTDRRLDWHNRIGQTNRTRAKWRLPRWRTTSPVAGTRAERSATFWPSTETA